MAKKWKYRNSILIIMFLAWVICYMDRMIMSVSIPYVAKEFGLTPVSMGVVMSAFLLGYALLQIPGGVLADKIGPRKTVVFSLLLWSVFTALTGMATSLTVLIIIRIFFGLAEGLFPGGYYKIIATWYPKPERATANGIAYSAQPFGIAVAAIVGTGIIASLGWRPLYYALSIPGVLIAVIIWYFLTDRPDQSRFVSKAELTELDESPEVELPRQGSYSSILKISTVWQSALTWFFFCIANWGYISWLPTYLVEARGFKDVGMGVAVALPFIASAVGLAVGGYLSDKLFSDRRKLYFGINMTLSAIFCGLAVTAGSAGPCVAFLSFSGLFLSMGMAAFWAIPMNTVPPEVMGLASSTISFCGIVGGFLAPIITGVLIQSTGNNYNYVLFTIMVALLITVPCLAAVKMPKRETQS